MLEFTVVDLHVACDHDEDCGVFFLRIKRKCLGDTRRLYSYSLSRQFNGSTGDGKFENLLVNIVFLKIVSYFLCFILSNYNRYRTTLVLNFEFNTHRFT